MIVRPYRIVSRGGESLPPAALPEGEGWFPDESGNFPKG